jgi:hypothetical protein
MLGLGADILLLLSEPKTVSRLWDEVKSSRDGKSDTRSITFDWFVLTLDMLYTIQAIEIFNGRIRKHQE